MKDEDVEFQKAVMTGLVPRMAESTFAVAVCPQDEDNYVDAKFCTELGVMIMLDKPILAVCAPGGKIPPKLELVADKIVHADIGTDEGQALLREAMNDLIAETS